MFSLPAQVSVLTVCTGNICRSPAAAFLLQAGLGDAIVASSAGTGTRPGWPLQPEIAQLLADDGIFPQGFASRPLTETILRGNELVLTMTREHRSRVVSMAPAVLRRTYTLREFARLGAQVPHAEFADHPDTEVGRLRALIAAAGKHRAPVPIEADEIDDPYGGNAAGYRRAYNEVRDAVEQVVALVRG